MKDTNIVLARRQQGAALLVALIMLVLISMLAAAGFFMSTGEARGAAGWSDRQRAMFAAEGALKQASESVAALVAANTDVEAAVSNLGTSAGYYLRKNGNVPELSPWPTSGVVTGTSKDARTSDVYYFVVYEGKSISTGNAIVNSTGALNNQAAKPRFTIYSKAGGIKDGTLVVLSTSKEF